MKVNYIHHLSCFFFRSERTIGMRPPHVSLYMALFRQWNNLKFCETMHVSRINLMHIGKIGSKDCYYRSMKQLGEMGFLQYFPAAHPHDQARVVMKRLDLIQSHLPLPEETGNIPQPLSVPDSDGNLPEQGHFNKQIQTENKSTPPSYHAVSDYFDTAGHTDKEALKFFNYYESIGWLQGGRSPIVNWKAAASKWMLNKKQGKHRAHRGQHGTDHPQDYGTPL